MSPSYATLSEGRVAHIHAVLPELKIIFLIRNPIQRTWSSAAMYFSKQGQPSLDDVDERHLMDYFRKRGSQRRSDYLRTLQIWEKHYAPRQIFIGFFDQLEQAPGLLLRDIYRFLSIDDSAQHIPERVSEKVNARSYPQMPTEISEYLTQQFSVQIQQLHQRFANEYTAAWLRSIQE